MIYDIDLNTHVQRVHDVIQRCTQHGITLHPNKFLFAQPSVSYCGFKLSADGYTIDDHLVNALTSFPIP